MRDELKPGENPRDALSCHRERGEAHKTYTYVDLAEILGMSVIAVRKAVSRGRFDPCSLRSVYEFARTRATTTNKLKAK